MDIQELLLSSWSGSAEVQGTSKAASVRKAAEMPGEHIKNLGLKKILKINIYVCSYMCIDTPTHSFC